MTEEQGYEMHTCACGTEFARAWNAVRQVRCRPCQQSRDRDNSNRSKREHNANKRAAAKVKGECVRDTAAAEDSTVDVTGFCNLHPFPWDAYTAREFAAWCDAHRGKQSLTAFCYSKVPAKCADQLKRHGLIPPSKWERQHGIHPHGVRPSVQAAQNDTYAIRK